MGRLIEGLGPKQPAATPKVETKPETAAKAERPAKPARARRKRAA